MAILQRLYRLPQRVEEVDISMDEQKPGSREMSIEDAVATLVSELPQPIREFVMGPKRDTVSLALTHKHNLHVDQAAVFERAYLHMLLGIKTPEEFSVELREAGIADSTVNALSSDVNDMVFIPLRAQMQNASPQPQPPTPQRAPLVPPMELVAPPAPVVPPPVPSAPNPLQSVPVPVSNPSLPDAYSVRTMAHDMEAVKNHQMPEPVVIPHPSVAPEVLPIAVPPTPPARSSTPPPNLPGVPLQKQYGVDPYREPME